MRRKLLPRLFWLATAIVVLAVCWLNFTPSGTHARAVFSYWSSCWIRGQNDLILLMPCLRKGMTRAEVGRIEAGPFGCFRRRGPTDGPLKEGTTMTFYMADGFFMEFKDGRLTRWGAQQDFLRDE